MKLPKSFFTRPDVVQISRELLGKKLCTRIGHGGLTAGIIVETEAYAGPDDRASHAFGMRRTPRTEVMYGDGGAVYVYLCYGIHSLLNVVTSVDGVPHAVLIRAIEPVAGIPAMLRRRGIKRAGKALTSGPGKLTQALGIDCSLNGASLAGRRIWIEDTGLRIAPADMVAAARVGVEYAGSDANRPWRFMVRGSRWTTGL